MGVSIDWESLPWKEPGPGARVRVGVGDGKVATPLGWVKLYRKEGT